MNRKGLAFENERIMGQGVPLAYLVSSVDNRHIGACLNVVWRVFDLRTRWFHCMRLTNLVRD